MSLLVALSFMMALFSELNRLVLIFEKKLASVFALMDRCWGLSARCASVDFFSSRAEN
jgi:hypothetical protein